MKKGVTPVVATVLLITITFGAAGTLYTMVEGNLQNSKQNTQTNIGINLDRYSMETCYRENKKSKIVLRNTGTDAMNTSKPAMLLNGALREYNSTPEIVDPQETFTIKMDDRIAGTTDIIFTNGQARTEFNCYTLPDGVPVRILSIGWNASDTHGGNAPEPPDGGSWGGIYSGYDDTSILPGTRSYGVAAFNRNTKEFLWKRQYDIYEGDDEDGDNTEDGIEAAGELAEDINNLPETENVVVVVSTADEPQVHRKANGLEAAMYSIGASESIYGAQNSGNAPFKYRSAYALVGSPALDKGEAYLERYKGESDRSKDAWIDVTYEIETSK